MLARAGEPARIDAFRDFASELGVLFQIVDDILDVTGTDDALGKPRGSDERHGKRTYVSEFGLDRARELAAESHRKARAALARGPPRAGPRSSSRSPTSSPPAAHERPPPDPAAHRPPAGPARAQRARAAAGRAGGARAHHRHGRGDRRPLRREPRHVRAGGRAALAARLPARQDPLGRRPPGLPAQGPHRPARPARDDPQVRGPHAVLLDRRVRARHHGCRPRLDLDRLRGRAQGGDAPRRRARTARSSR